jgi:sulfite exporter TauE/SafE/copper chaperone CopZ
MGKKQTTIFVAGMTCSSCEARISAALRKVPGVVDAKASLKGGTAWVEYEDENTSVDQLQAVIEKIGYAVKDKRSAAGTMIALGIGVVLVAIYMIATQAGLFNSLPKVDASIGYGMLFVIGLLTSVHCVAMCGGIALSQSATMSARLGPGLLYNAGRIISYTIIGGIVGALGSAFSFSPIVKGIIAAAAGLFMVVLGFKMLGIISKIPSPSRLFPVAIRESIGRFGTGLGRGFRKRGPFAVGLLNGLMPCGPLQTMQLYALGTGSAFAGALSMFIFSAGTVPLMLGFGFAAALLPRRLMPVMIKASAVLVMFLGVVTFARAASLAGIALPTMRAGSASAKAKALLVSDASSEGPLAATLSGGSQAITTVFGPNNYVPFVVKAGVPLKWTIRIRAADLNGCNDAIAVPEYGIQKKLEPGDNLVEFTPKKEGVIAYSCWMGMIRSRITVVADIGKAAPGSAETLPPDQGIRLNDLLNQGGTQSIGGCCSGASNPAFAGVAARGDQSPIDTIGLPVIKDGFQEITVDVSAQG